MPLYDYRCRSCGDFREWRGMGDYDKPVRCPGCRRSARRSLSSPVLGMDWQAKRAHAINERSAHEPRVVRRRRGDGMAHDVHADLTRARKPRGGHARGHDDGHREVGALGERQLQRSRHPWMVRH